MLFFAIKKKLHFLYKRYINSFCSKFINIRRFIKIWIEIAT